MNKGVKAAKGEWLYFLGCDDKLYTGDVFKKVVEVFEQENFPDVIYGNVFSTRFNGIYDGEFTIEKIFHQNICHQAIFFRKTVFNKIGNFNVKYKANADWDFNLRWFLSKKIKKQYFIYFLLRDN